MRLPLWRKTSSAMYPTCCPVCRAIWRITRSKGDTETIMRLSSMTDHDSYFNTGQGSGGSRPPRTRSWQQDRLSRLPSCLYQPCPGKRCPLERGADSSPPCYPRTYHECLWPSPRRAAVRSSGERGEKAAFAARMCTQRAPEGCWRRTRIRNPFTRKELRIFTIGGGGGN